MSRYKTVHRIGFTRGNDLDKFEARMQEGMDKTIKLKQEILSRIADNIHSYPELIPYETDLMINKHTMDQVISIDINVKQILGIL